MEPHTSIYAGAAGAAEAAHAAADTSSIAPCRAAQAPR
jgi:hypothetical protein